MKPKLFNLSLAHRVGQAGLATQSSSGAAATLLSFSARTPAAQSAPLPSTHLLARRGSNAASDDSNGSNKSGNGEQEWSGSDAPPGSGDNASELTTPDPRTLGHMHAHVHKAQVAVESVAEGVVGAAKQAQQVAAEVAGQAKAAVTGSPPPEPPEANLTERYKRELRLGGDASGASHEAQDTAYESWHQPGARPIEEQFPNQVAAARMQNEEQGDTPRLHEKTRRQAEQERSDQQTEGD